MNWRSFLARIEQRLTGPDWAGEAAELFIGGVIGAIIALVLVASFGSYP